MIKLLFYFILLATAPLVAREFWSLPLKTAAPHGLASDEDTLWISDYENQIIYRFDQLNAAPVALPFAPARPRGLVLNDELVGGAPTQVLYVAAADAIYRFNGSTGEVLSQFSSPDSSITNFQGLAIGQGSLWVASRDPVSDRVYRYNLATQTWVGFFDAPGSNPRGLSFHDGSLWNIDSNSDLLYRLSPVDGSVLDSYQIPFTSSPRGLTFFQGRFHLSGLSLQTVIPFQITEQSTNVYLAEKRLPLSDSSLQLPYLSSHALDHQDDKIKRILVYQHGIDSNAAVYFARGIHAAIQADALEETFVVGLQMLDDVDFVSAPPASLVYWPSGRAWGSLSASSSAIYPRIERVSSFAVLDQLLTSLTEDSDQFPNLSEIVISGHSGGGQFVNRYAVSSRFNGANAPGNRHIALKYIVMNPSSYVYFNNGRVEAGSISPSYDALSFAVPQDPSSNYNNYGYGLDSLYRYPSATGRATIESQYPQRRVVYLVGGNDTGTGDLDASAQAMLQGQNRLERSRVYYAHLKDHFGEGNLPYHRFGVVPGVGHNGGEMITSELGLEYHFTKPLKVNFFSLEGDIVTMAWSGGEISADVWTATRVMEDRLLNWTRIATGIPSPLIFDASVVDDGSPSRFFQIRERASAD